jgi:ribosomal-protein-alanine N-acetyltransferase
MTDNQVAIRLMQTSDLEQVQAIDQLSFSMPWPASAYEYELLENPYSLLWVAEIPQHGKAPVLVGVVVVWLILDEAHIASIAVHPDYRSQGTAQLLLANVLREAIQKGSQLATLEVRARNLIAQRLYQRFKFEVIGKRVHYYRDNNEDALIMTVTGLGPEYLEWLDQGLWRADPSREI